MMETIASWLAEIVGQLLDLMVSFFLGLMNLDLGTIAGYFPALITGYKMFQSIGIGLIICIAVYQLIKFFGGALVEVNDTPVRILVRAFIAGMLLWFGGYLIQLVVDLAAIPYQAFVGVDAADAEIGIGWDLDSFSMENLFMDLGAVTFSVSTIIVTYIIIMLVIGWNLMKLMIEVLERYLMVAILAFSAPLVYPTLTSQSTSNVFRSWLSMFLGQCALMTISAWMLKLCISGFSFSPDAEGMAFRLLLTLALCKIAQRADTYLQSLGIGVATTGGNLMDEAIGGFLALSRGSGIGKADAKERASKDSVLGENADESTKGIRGKIKDWAKPRAFGSVAGLANVGSEIIGATNEKDENGNKKRAPFSERIKPSNLIKEYQAGYEETPQRLAEAGKGALDKIGKGALETSDKVAEAAGKQASNFVGKHPWATGLVNSARNAVEDVQGAISKVEEWATSDSKDVAKGYPVDDATKEDLENSNTPGGKAKNISQNINTFDKDFSGLGFEVDENDPNVIQPSANAVEKGISFDKDNNVIQGDNPESLNDYMQNSMPEFAKNDAMTDMASNTLESNNELAAWSLNDSTTKGVSADSFEDPQQVSNMNKMGASMVEGAFEGGIENVTGGDVTKGQPIEHFESSTDEKANPQVSFTAKDANGQDMKYELTTNPDTHPNATKIEAANGETWYVNKKEVSSGPLPEFNKNEPSGGSSRGTNMEFDQEFERDDGPAPNFEQNHFDPSPNNDPGFDQNPGQNNE